MQLLDPDIGAACFCRLPLNSGSPDWETQSSEGRPNLAWNMAEVGRTARVRLMFLFAFVCDARRLHCRHSWQRGCHRRIAPKRDGLSIVSQKPRAQLRHPAARPCFSRSVDGIGAAKSGRTSRSWVEPMAAAAHWPAKPRSARTLVAAREPLSGCTLGELDDGADFSQQGRAAKKSGGPDRRVRSTCSNSTADRCSEGTCRHRPFQRTTSRPNTHNFWTVHSLAIRNSHLLVPRGEVNKRLLGPCRPTERGSTFGSVPCGLSALAQVTADPAAHPAAP